MVKGDVFSISCDEQYQDGMSEPSAPKRKEQRNDRVSLFNAVKRSERCPDLEGHFNLGEIKYKLVLWTRVSSKTGKQYHTGFVNMSS